MSSAQERWHDLCELVAAPDGLPTWEEAGHWTEDKLYFWKRYIDITTMAMSGQQGRQSFPGGLVYVDLFAGSGVCTQRGATKKRFPGSALIAAYADPPFRKIIACEENPEYADACKTRLLRSPAAERSVVLNGDCNALIGDVVAMIRERALTLAFVDPKGLDIQFTTIQTLCTRARADIVILLPDAYDILRNELQLYRENPESKLDQFLGPDSDWRSKLDDLENPTGANKRQRFADIYKSQLERLLGYTAFGEKVIRRAGRPLYRLVYASRHKLGLKFWNQALKEDAQGQPNLFD